MFVNEEKSGNLSADDASTNRAAPRNLSSRSPGGICIQLCCSNMQLGNLFEIARWTGCNVARLSGLNVGRLHIQISASNKSIAKGHVTNTPLIRSTFSKLQAG